MGEPKSEDFGLTTEKYETVKKWDAIVRTIYGTIVKVISFVLGGFFYINAEKPTSQGLTIFGFLIGGVFVGSIIGFVLLKIVERSVEIFLSSISPRFKAAYKYKKAKKKYVDWLSRIQVNYWTSLSGRKFEKELAYLYKRLGYRVKLTPPSGDKGIDIEMIKGNSRTIVQCKAHNKPVGPHTARDLYGTLINSKADMAILASTTGFTKGVWEFVAGKPIELVSIDDIVRMQKSLDEAP